MMYTVIRDTREQSGQGWVFDSTAHCEGTTRRRLKTGDYSIVGLEADFTIERKGSVSEFFGNVMEKRFERELVRLNMMKYPYILLEFTQADIDKFPVDSGIPPRLWESTAQRYRWKNLDVGAKFIRRRIREIQEKYPNIILLLTGSEGHKIADKIIREIYGKTKEELGN